MTEPHFKLDLHDNHDNRLSIDAAARESYLSCDNGQKLAFSANTGKALVEHIFDDVTRAKNTGITEGDSVTVDRLSFSNPFTGEEINRTASGEAALGELSPLQRACTAAKVKSSRPTH